jgi:hypothetical protein
VPELLLPDLLDDLEMIEVRSIIMRVIFKEFLDNTGLDQFEYYATYLSES